MFLSIVILVLVLLVYLTIVGLLTKKMRDDKVLLSNKFDKQIELLNSTLYIDRSIFSSEVEELRIGLLAEIAAKRRQTEADLHESLKTRQEQIFEMTKAQVEIDEAKLVGINESIQKSVDISKREHAKMEKHMMDNLKKDITSNIVAAAYAVAAANMPSRGIRDSELLKAVLRHKQEMGPSKFLKPGEKLPDSGSLN